ncbi:hypothetical protein ZWY2020_041523 [Hordeum vulgare]|nr:hypothetical protein ZWY2020_041523 [Hordeum vulgare]
MGEQAAAAPWRISVSDFQMPERPKEPPPFASRVFIRGHVQLERTGTHGCNDRFHVYVSWHDRQDMDSLVAKAASKSKCRWGV